MFLPLLNSWFWNILGLIIDMTRSLGVLRLAYMELLAGNETLLTCHKQSTLTDSDFEHSDKKRDDENVRQRS